MTEEAKMQYMANGIILACEILIMNSFYADSYKTINNVSKIISESDVTKEEWNNCEDDFAKEKIIELFENEEEFYQKVGWIK